MTFLILNLNLYLDIIVEDFKNILIYLLIEKMTKGHTILVFYSIYEEQFIGLDKSGNQVNNFLISQQKHMLWVLIRSTSVRHF